MKRRTVNFIMSQNGQKPGILSVLDRKKLIIIGSCVLGALILGGLYLWYVRNYANARKVELESIKPVSYEWVNGAAEEGIVKEFLWSRTKELMLKNATDNTLIVDKITLPGKLIDQTLEESGHYSLSDQALLLKIYVRDNERIKAMSLVSEIDKHFVFENESVKDKVAYLDAYLEYYSSYGSKSDLQKIEAMTNQLFEEDGTLKPSLITVAVYHGQAYVSSYDAEAALQTGNATGELESSNNDDGTVDTKTVEGVLLSSVNLRLIKELEKNGFIPEGAYEKNLKIVKDAVISSDIPLYSFLYTLENGEVEYIYSAGSFGTFSIEESVETMRNLAQVGELPESAYSWIKVTLYGTEAFYDTYYLASTGLGGNESFSSYITIAEIAVLYDDRDVFDLCAQRIGVRIATLDSSPALSMVFRTEGTRNVVYAKDNLGVYLLIR
ncbi:MAG: hypothetical protein K6F83_00160 [Clostridiales bacterium]|nr:hypothetical protein [Clostridiales bacterium]